MPKTKKTDLQVLRAILSLPTGGLSGKEKSAFQSMYDSLATGRVVGLSEGQRAWANVIYDKNKLDEERPPAKHIEVKDKSLILQAFDALPRPLKPPGRR